MPEESEIVQKLLHELERWGWETGYRKLEREIAWSEQDQDPEARAFFLAWMAAERGEFAQAEKQINLMSDNSALAKWGHFVRAFMCLRRAEYEFCQQFLAVAQKVAGGDGSFLAAIGHVRGSLRYHLGDLGGAKKLLLGALCEVGGIQRGHFGVGRILDTLGMVYASENNFHAAREFFHQSLQQKERHGDKAGLALGHGQLGRLYSDWGLWPLAEKNFREDLKLCKEIFDGRGEAQMCNALGQVALAQGNMKEAADWLDEAIRLCRNNSAWKVLEGYARKDRALAAIAAGGDADLARAEEELASAEKLFHEVNPAFVEGLAHASRARGLLYRHRRKYSESQQSLQDALRYFKEAGELAEVADTQWEMVRTDCSAGASGAPVREGLLTALATAENSRRGELVRRIERDLKTQFPEAYYAHIYRRIRGGAADGDTASLMEGKTESLTVLFLDIQGSTPFVRDHDPAEVMLTINQLMGDLVAVLRKHEAHVNVFRGDGFLALVRGENNARRAVDAALEINEAVARFNEPRKTILTLPELATRIGISTGAACLGNVGTYDKMEFTALGKAVNLGARLEPAATPGQPCISLATRDELGNRFKYRDDGGREIEAKGFGPLKVRVWDVIGRAS